jgi:predicted DNA-binding protein (MmcQ/YjbR family)
VPASLIESLIKALSVYHVVMDRAELLEIVEERYGMRPEFPWSRWPNYAVLRHPGNRKWFGVLMDVPADRLGLDGAEVGEKVEILNVKVDPDDVLVLRLADSIMPAYHMNKDNWVSVAIEGDIPGELVLDLLETSHRLTA